MPTFANKCVHLSGNAYNSSSAHANVRVRGVLQLSGAAGRAVAEVARPLLREFGLLGDAGEAGGAALRLAGSRARVDPSADAALLEGEVLLSEVPVEPEADARVGAAQALLRGERAFADALGAAQELYARPLHKLQCLPEEQHRALFAGLALLAPGAALLQRRLTEALEVWVPGGSEPDLEWLFPEELWDGFDSFLESYGAARRLLRQKAAADDELLELCRLRRGAALDTPQSLLELPVRP
ncbi:Putative rho guanine nucleotide exchange factor vav3, partial [Gryllus bimaculatus]